MLTRVIKRRSTKFYESMRNRFNQLHVLRDGDYVYDVESGLEWKLLEDVNINGFAKGCCTFAPNGSGVKLGTPMNILFFDDRDKLSINFKRGMNPNRRF